MSDNNNSNIHSIMPGVDPLAGSAHDGIIDDIEYLLGMAKRGELKAFAYCYRRGNGDSGSGWDCDTGTAVPLLGAVGLLQQRMTTAALRVSETVSDAP